MSICYAVTPGGWKGLRRTPFASLTPAPPTIYFVPLRGTRILRAPPPARVRGWTRLRNPFHPPFSISILPSPSPSSLLHLHLPSPSPSPFSISLLHCHPHLIPTFTIATRYLQAVSLSGTYHRSIRVCGRTSLDT